MAQVLVLVEHHGGAVRGATYELLTLAQRLGEPVAVWVIDGDEPADAAAARAAAPELARFGATEIAVLTGDAGELLGDHLARPTALALAKLVGESAPRAVLAVSSFENKEIAAHLGLATGSGVLVDLSDVAADDSAPHGLVADQTILAGSWTAQTAASAVGPPILLIKPGAVTATPAGAPIDPALRILPVSLPDAARRTRVVSREHRPATGRPDLASAQIVVVGGRGTEGDFGPVEELAAELGAAVGATRVATDEGWIDHSAQVGQTGVTIAPRLYIGAGVSGAVHHRGGMQASQTIVAVNSDADAPIFEMVDFGVVGDLATVLPQAAAELRRLRQ